MMSNRRVVGFRLSQQQQRLWRLREQIGADLRPVRGWLRLEGSLDVPHLQEVFHHLVLRHEALRTRFEVAPGSSLPIQVIDDATTIVQLRDLSKMEHRPIGEEHVALALAEIENEPTFNDLCGAALRAELVRFSIGLHYLLIVISPLCGDRTSLHNLVHKLVAGYGAEAGSRQAEEPLDYADYTAWQEDVISGDTGEGARYWRGQHRSDAFPVQLALENWTTDKAIFDPSVMTLRLSQGQVNAVTEYAAGHYATPETILLATWAALLSRHTGLPEIELAYLSDGRSEPIATAIGAFLRPLPLRCIFNAGETFPTLVRRLQATLEEHRDWQDYVAADFVFSTRGIGERELPIGFGYVSALVPHRSRTVLMTLEREAALVEPFRLHLQCLVAQESITVEFHHDRARLSPAAVECLAEQWLTLLTHAMRVPDLPIEHLSLLSVTERERLIGELSPLVSSVAFEVNSLHELIERQAKLIPQALAVRHGEIGWTYYELNSRADSLAARLLAQGLNSEDRVGLLIRNPLRMVVAIFAVLKAGGAYVPLDPDLPRERLEWMTRDAAVALILAERSFAGMADLFAPPTIYLDDAPDGDYSGGQIERPTVPTLPDQLAYLIYTSGSTGRPKGVAVSHRSALHSTLSRHRHYTAPIRGFLLLSPFSFDSSVAGLFWTLSQGGCLCLPLVEEMQDLEALAGLIERHDLSHILCLPSFYKVLLEQDCTRFRCLMVSIIAGESCPPSLPLLHYGRLPGTRLYNEYGPTEATVWSTVLEFTPQSAHRAVSIGRPIEGVRIYLLDEQQEPVPRGIVGEAYIGGAGVARGYFRRPDLTAERFLPDPFGQDGGRLYRTGDLARLGLDRQLDFVGRADQQIKVRGYRIEMGEIETSLLAMPEVGDCAVMMREDHPGDKRLVAYVVARKGDLDRELLRTKLRRVLPDYMVPSIWVIIENLPKTSNGKLDRARLPAPDRIGAKGGNLIAPRNDIEATLLEIWQQLLRTDQISIEDNFFELGGDSILSIQMVGRARQRGLAVTARQLFEHQTIAALASVAVTPAPAEYMPASGGDIPLTPIQRWFFDLNYARPERWTHALLLALREPIELPAMDAALVAIFRHHHALRTRFVREKGTWRQLVAQDCPGAAVSRIELPLMPEAEQLAEMRRIASERMEIDLGSGQMLQLVSAKTEGGGPGYLLLVMSYLVADGLSWRIVLEDLELAYRQAQAGSKVSLPIAATSFAEWAERLQRYAQTEPVRAEVSYWIGLLRDPLVPLPVDDPEGDHREHTSAVIQTVLDEAATQALLHRVSSAYRTGIEDFLLTALALTLSNWGCGKKVLIDVDYHGREALFAEVDLTRTLGWFTSVSPYLFSVDPEVPLANNLKSVKETMRQASQRGLHYGLICYLDASGELAPILRDLPQARILFNYMGQLDPSFAPGSLFSLVGGEVLESRDPEWRRPYELAVNADILDGRLRITWDYSAARYRCGTLDALAHDCLENLRALIAHCVLPDAGGYTPSDFPLARLSQPQLDQLFEGVRCIEDVYPLTPLQQGILFHALYAPGSGVYVEQLSCTLRGPLDGAAFTAAWRQVMASDAILRSSFLWEGLEAPVQVVHAKAALPFEEQDWRGVPADEKARRWAAYLEADRQVGFDFARAPLMRLALMRCAEDCWLFLWSHHHVLLDGWSGPLVLKDVFVAYLSLIQGERIQFVPRKPFRDYLVWLSGQNMTAAEAYWRRSLAGFRVPTSLPFNSLSGGDPLRSGGRYAETCLTLSANGTRVIEDFARRHQVTLNTLVQGAWAVLLSRYSGERDVLFGVTVSGRPAELVGVEAMVGLFINTLPLRVAVPPEARVADWLRLLFAQNLDLRHYEYAPLVEIQGWSEVPRGEPLFASLLAFENYPLDVALREQQGMISVENVHFAEQTHYPLTIVAFPGPQLKLKVNHDCERFDARGVTRMLEHFSILLEGIVASPETRLSDLPLLPAAERAKIVLDWSGADEVKDRAGPQGDLGLGDPGSCCLPELFEARAARAPDAVAVVCEGEALTYGELNARANQLAHHLRGLGIGPEVVVGLCVERSLEMVIGILGILKAGGAYLPLDPAYPKDRLDYLLDDAGTLVLLTQEKLLACLPGTAAKIVCLDRDASLWALAADADLPPLCGPANLAYVIYTSGSTGRPKGVMVTHGNATGLFVSTEAAFGFGPEDVWTLFHSYAFDFSVWEMWGALLYGGRLVVVPYWVSRAPEAFHDLLAGAGVTVLNQTPSAFRQLLQTDAFAEDCRRLSLRLVIFGGEALDPQNLRPWFERYGEAYPRLVNMYGITETTVHVTMCDQGFAQLAGKGSVIGRPIEGVRTYLLDAYLHPVPIGVAGELYIGGAGLARGYLGRPGLTAERFVPNPFCGAGERLYRSGDLARYRSDGTIEYLGRIDHQVKVRGHRIELGEIEAALCEHPVVREAIVALSDAEVDRRGNGDQRLVAYIVTQPISRDINGAPEEQIEQWRTVFDDAFRSPSPSADPQFNISGWISSYNGTPIPTHEMQEWVDQTVARIRTLNPRKVLEIGCGTGVLLFRLAPGCSRYVGTDFSASAVDYVSGVIAKSEPDLAHVELLHRAADQFVGLEDASFDTVVLNSVVQYFPNINYFVGILDGVARLIEPGGRIFLGDLRHFGLLQAFLLAVELQNASTSSSALISSRELRNRLHLRLLEEEELLIDPAFFALLAPHLARLGRVEVLLKRGGYPNEMTQFRYDAILHFDFVTTLDSAWLDWTKEKLTVTELRARLSRDKPNQLLIAGVPNRRVSGAVRAASLMEDKSLAVADGPIVDRLRRAWAESSDAAVDPEEISAIAEDLPYKIELCWSRGAADGSFEIVCARRDSEGEPPTLGWLDETACETRPPLCAYANDPLQGRTVRGLISKLREGLRAALPDYMVPGTFMILPALPLTENGKVDRKALSASGFGEHSQARYAAARNPTEEILVGIWAEVLGQPRVGIYDNFFELGGHSLLATQVMSRLRKAFQIELPLRRLFEAPTPAELTQVVEAALIESLEMMSEEDAERLLDNMNARNCKG